MDHIMTTSRKDVGMRIEIDDSDPIGSLVSTIMSAIEPVCRAPDAPERFDGNRAVDALGAAAAMIFAGIPEPFRDEQVENWITFVRKAAKEIELDRYHIIKVGSRA